MHSYIVLRAVQRIRVVDDVWRPLYHLRKGATVQDVLAGSAQFHVPNV